MKKFVHGLVLILLLGCDSNSLGDPIAPVNSDSENQNTFLTNLPNEVQSNVIWNSDFEDASFKKWEDKGTSDEFAGGGIFNTDESNVSFGVENSIVHTGKHSSFAQIKNAVTPGEPKAIRFMRWTDKAWDEEGQYFPDEAYYSVFIYFPEIFDPTKLEDNDALGDGGWWNIFQFKSDNNAGSQPMAALDLYNSNGKMFLGMSIKDYENDDSDEHVQEYIEQVNPFVLESNTWVHLEAYYKKSPDYNGQITVWQDGQLILEKKDFRSIFFDDGTAVWGIGNYTDYINGGEVEGKARVYFDDALVSTTRIGEHLE